MDATLALTFPRLPRMVALRALRTLLTLVALVAPAGCASEPSPGELRDDRDALAQLLGADAATARSMDPALESLGAGQGSQEALRTLRGRTTELAALALQKAGRAKLRTAPGRALVVEVKAALAERRHVIDLCVRGLDSQGTEDLLEAVRAARALEETWTDLDVRVQALPATRP